MQSDVIGHPPTRDYVRGLSRRIAQDYGITARHDDLRGVVVNDGVADQHRLIALDTGFLPIEVEQPRPRVEHGPVGLVASGAVSRFRH